MFDNDLNTVFYGAKVGLSLPDSKAPDRIVGDQKELTEEELKPPPPPPAPVSLFGGGMFGGGGSLFGGTGLFAPSAASYGASHFSFGAPVYPAPSLFGGSVVYSVSRK